MIQTAILNVILAVGVIVMVVTPLVWAILTQHRDHPRAVPRNSTTVQAAQNPERRRERRAPVKTRRRASLI